MSHLSVVLNAHSHNPGDETVYVIVKELEIRLGRTPTEDEIFAFMYGNDDEKMTIWNSVGQ